MASLPAAADIPPERRRDRLHQKARSAMTTQETPLNPRTISRDHLKQMLDRKVKFTLVEVLDAEEFNASHLPGAINIPLNDHFDSAISAALPDKNRKVVVYCADKSCNASTQAARRLATLGYERVRDFKGGKQAWQEADGAATEQSTPPVTVPVTFSAVAAAN
jgi:rhodanese-related sulfurtransferase